MKRLKLRINLTLCDSSVGFESLHQELELLPDEKKRRHRILTILQNYSREMRSHNSFPPPTAVLHQSVLASALPVCFSNLDHLGRATPDVISNSEAARNAMANSDMGFE